MYNSNRPISSYVVIVVVSIVGVSVALYLIRCCVSVVLCEKG